MRWLTLSVREYAAAARGRLLVSAMAFCLVVGLGNSLLYVNAYERGPELIETVGIAGAMFMILSGVVPVLAVVASSDAIARKRSRGTLRVMLGLPYNRLDIVAGTFVGRYAVVATAVTLYVSVVALTSVVIGSPLGVERLATFFAITLLLAMVFTGLAVCLSLQTQSVTRAFAGSLVVLAVFLFRLWGFVPTVVELVRNGMVTPETMPEWGLVFQQLNPIRAFTSALIGLYPELASAHFLGEVVEPPVPYYHQPSFALAVLGAWVLVPLVVAYLRFRTADI
ncbi:hypothetical protein C453_16448 [Haloferax elongans ATCC BAA-1513]|uniref:Copper ABC transporter permease n=1 Tax=Haloferax elongans ATCC BAA-1513 TaxID=1230453 RepID=M0HFX3_HALEO|nr:ABC transporter permease subunit [Haloferax elongans]ELZ82693.1 hypothetical protein C453_16448 [Haloferax elongans ATCC BAA-1513]